MDNSLAGSSPPFAPLGAFPLVADSPAATHGQRMLARLRASAPLVAPSLLMCDFGHLADEVARLESAGVQVFHLDVMDGHFVPNLTYGLPIVEAVRRLTKLPIEAHLMIADPRRYGAQFVSAGADSIVFHIEAQREPRPLLDELHQLGAAAGLAYNPETPLSAIVDYLDQCDTVLTMSVSPGFGGQAFNPAALENLRELSQRKTKALLGIDGGVNESTIAECTSAGAQVCVVGSAIFKHQDYRQAVDRLTQVARSSSRTC